MRRSSDDRLPPQRASRRDLFERSQLRAIPPKWSRRLERSDLQYYQNARPVWYWSVEDGREFQFKGNLWELSLNSWVPDERQHRPELTYYNTRPWLMAFTQFPSSFSRAENYSKALHYDLNNDWQCQYPWRTIKPQRGYDQRLARDDRRFSIPFDLPIYREEMFRLRPLLSSSDINRFFWRRYPYEKDTFRGRRGVMRYDLNQRGTALPLGDVDNAGRKPFENRIV